MTTRLWLSRWTTSGPTADAPRDRLALPVLVAAVVLAVVQAVGPTVIRIAVSGRPGDASDVSSALATPFPHGADVLKSICDLLIAALALFAVVRQRARVPVTVIRCWPLFALYALSAVAAVVASEGMHASDLMLPCLVVVVVLCDHERLAFRCLAVGGAAIAAASLALRVIDPSSASMVIPKNGGDYSGLAGVFDHPNTLGMCMALVLGALLALPLRAAAFASVPVLVVLFMSGSRTAQAAAGSGVIIWFGLVAWRRTARPPWSRMARLPVLVAGVVTVGYVGLNSWLIATATPGGFDGRGAVWIASVHQWRDRPWLGHGPDFFHVAASRSTDPFPKFAFHAHNELAQMLVTVGVIGALLWAALIFVVTRMAVARSIKGVHTPIILVIVWLALQVLEVPTAFFILTSLSFVVWIGLAATLTSDQIEDPQRPRDRRKVHNV